MEAYEVSLDCMEGIESSHVPELEGQMDSQESDYTGRLGELLVWKWLAKLAADCSVPFGAGGEGWAARWVNKECESGKPYDIVVERNGVDHEVFFVEVKSTSTSDVRAFEISTEELASAHQHGCNYIVARAFNISRTADRVRIVLISNPWEGLQRNH